LGKRKAFDIGFRSAIGPDSSNVDTIQLIFARITGLSFISMVKREERSDIIENEYNNLNN